MITSGRKMVSIMPIRNNTNKILSKAEATKYHSSLKSLRFECFLVTPQGLSLLISDCSTASERLRLTRCGLSPWEVALSLSSSSGEEISSVSSSADVTSVVASS